jgi:phenylpropionate dioxygenase-like ring-hydroxylating dioxygenase large terminal subunit
MSSAGAIAAEGYEALVQRDRVSSRIFTDEAVFAEEQERIFEGDWVYVAHESEVPQRGDYVTRHLGRQPVIVVRSREGVRVHLNRCRHRGTALCTRPAGNTRFFRCPYHGWTYDNDGTLVGVPYPSGYGADFDKAEMGLQAAPFVEAYRGFVFASVAAPSTSLSEWLGPRVREVMDAFVDASPVGRILVRAGVNRTIFHGNWKYVGMDGYHFNFTHKSINALNERHGKPPIGEYQENAPGRMWDFGNGHCRLDHDELRKGHHTDELIARIRSMEGGPNYLAELESRLGDRMAQTLSRSHDPHLGVWPNLQLLGFHIRLVRPLGPDRTEILAFPTLLEGAPDAVNEERVARHQLLFGPSGFVQPDDHELFERNQLGLQASVNPWIVIARGLDREQVHPDGAISSHVTDETTQRGQMRMWLRQMTRTRGAGDDLAE